MNYLENTKLNMKNILRTFSKDLVCGKTRLVAN